MRPLNLRVLDGADLSTSSAVIHRLLSVLVQLEIPGNVVTEHVEALTKDIVRDIESAEGTAIKSMTSARRRARAGELQAFLAAQAAQPDAETSAKASAFLDSI